MWPTLFRRVRDVQYTRERLELPDGDFLDLDWSRVGSNRVVLVAHGLEGSSQAVYVRGLVRALNRRKWDALAWNLRGCSGEPNRLPRSYHSGASEDLAAVVQRVVGLGYRLIAVVGFSLGGNLTLKFLGEGRPEACCVAVGVGISVPCDLHGAAERLSRPECAFYLRRFLRTMVPRMSEKRRRFGTGFPAVSSDAIRTFRDFDDQFTAPLHGFRDAADYWRQCSSLGFLGGIQVPTLILSAGDDPFLSPGCFPRDAAKSNGRLTVEVPMRGGHVGFVGGSPVSSEYWSEGRIAKFLEDSLGES
ncbi:MAG: alpha/beta fold hydrolase [Verrucomicrobiales bacterium]|nr:alpha/beta fold hydrolase [Verrucomicrobiales bacterium]